MKFEFFRPNSARHKYLVEKIKPYKRHDMGKTYTGGFSPVANRSPTVRREFRLRGEVRGRRPGRP